MQFLSRHPFAFAPFPSQYYVGVRRNLPFFDYATFYRRINPNNEKNRTWSSFQSYPNFQSRPVSRPLLQSTDSFEQLSPVDATGGGGLTPLAGLQSTGLNNPLANAHAGLGGLSSGFGGGGGTAMNGQGQHSSSHGNTPIGAGPVIGGGLGGLGSGGATPVGGPGIGSNVNGVLNPQSYLMTTQAQQPTTQAPHTLMHNTTTVQQQQQQPHKPLFSLFGEI